MGIQRGIVASATRSTLALEKLRDTVRRRQAGDRSPRWPSVPGGKGQFARWSPVLRRTSDTIQALAHGKGAEQPRRRGGPRGLRRRVSGADSIAIRWPRLEFLENRLAPQATDADMLFLRYVGTTHRPFAGSFRSVAHRRGQPIPAGKRGLSVSKIVYETSSSSRPPIGSTRSRMRGSARLRIANGFRAGRFRSREQQPGARDPASARRRRRRSSCQAATRAGLAGGRRRQLLAELFKRTTRTSIGAYAFFYGSWPLRWTCTGCGWATPHHQGLHQERLCPVGQAARLRHLRLPGPGEAGAGRRPHVHDLVSFRERTGF